MAQQVTRGGVRTSGREPRRAVTGVLGQTKEAVYKVAGRERRFEEATPTSLPGRPNPTGPRRCGGPEHSVGLSTRRPLAPQPRGRWPVNRPELIAGPRLAEPTYRNQPINLLIGPTFPNQPKTLWLTPVATQPKEQLRRVGNHAVAAIAFGAVERLVGALEESSCVALARTESGDADRDRDVHAGRALLNQERLAGDSPADAFRHQRGHRHVGFRHDDDELFPAIAAGKIDAADRLAHAH